MNTPLLTRRLALLGLGAALTIRPQWAAAHADHIAALRSGGHIVCFRHGATTWSGVDKLEWPRQRQRLLSALGEEQSRRIGAAFRSHDIPVGDVLASPFARCRDMAEIAFGRVEERMELVGLLSDREGRNARIAYLEQLFKTAPRDGTNRVIVTHSSNIRTVAGESLGEGDGVVIRPNGDGFSVRASFTPDDWG